LHKTHTPWYPSMEFVQREDIDNLLAHILKGTSKNYRI